MLQFNRSVDSLHFTDYYHYYYFGVRCARPGESEDTLSVKRPQPHTTNPWKEEKNKTVGDEKERARSCQQESIGSALETRQSNMN